MKEGIPITSWREFEEFLGDLKNRDEWIFRGQKDFDLESTLYRECGEKAFVDYRIDAIRQLEKIKIKSLENLTITITYLNDSFGYIPYYVFGKRNVNAKAFIYLRHYGYPSPLLDWTKNPYIAAYFAFNEELDSNENVAIYCYREPINDDHYEDKVQGGWTGESYIIYIDPVGSFNVKRHIAQEAVYTCALAKDKNGSDCVFCSHQSILNIYRKNKDTGRMGYYEKLLLSSSLRECFLNLLKGKNINEDSLFPI